MFGGSSVLKGQPGLCFRENIHAVRAPVVTAIGMRAIHADLFDTVPFTLEIMGAIDRLPSLIAQTGILMIKRTNGDTETSYSFGIGASNPADTPYWTVFDTAANKTSITGNRAVGIGQPFHLAATISAGLVMQLFVDGVKMASTPTAPALYTAGTDSFLYLMSGVGSERFVGRALPGAVYNKVLSDARILAHANAALSDPTTIIPFGSPYKDLSIVRRPPN